ncbi:geraniol 8-hydroxylase-like [Lycium ferocissimum]|uniref:geraniol 8-hydroxylase-like n=1 Tax=Lycium ferocissimum TaxID=112874 RepID=UPI0028149C0E|nr:geraniol 8-hydroxylase-like [Lycium ferocissimum]
MDYIAIFGGLVLAWTLVKILCLVQEIRSRGYNNRKLPPGPIHLPFIGNLHNLLGEQPHKSLARLGKKYGPIFSLKLGNTTTMVISSSAGAKEVLQKQELAFSRTVPDAMHAHNHHQFSVIWLSMDNRWRQLRKILNTYIFSGNRLDANQYLRSRKIKELIAYCQKHSQTGEAVDIGQATFYTSLSLLSNTIFSRDFADPYVNSGKEFRELVCKFMKEFGKPNIVDFFPILKRMDPQGIRRRISIHGGMLLKLFEGLIDERMEHRKLQTRTSSNDVLDVLLNVSQEDPKAIEKKDIEHMFLDLFVAGTETTSNTVEWAMAEVMKNANVMRKAQTELEEVIGKGKVIEEKDISVLPYLQCIVKETMRLHPPGPFFLRNAKQDVEVCGYFVPKGSLVVVNVWLMGRDPNIWEDPLVFKPERFWGSEFEVRGQDFELIPFGGGRRICPGLPLAMRIVPVILGSLLNSFDWKVEGEIAPKDLDMEEKFGLTLAKSCRLRVVPIPL